VIRAIAKAIVRMAAASAGMLALVEGVGAAKPIMLPAVHVASQAAATCAQSAKKVFDLAIVNGRVTGVDATLRVQQGDEVELRWSSDRPLSLHLHGYDIETNVPPYVSTVMSFKARLAGRFPVSEHREGARERTILYIEVHP
jgi:FtsP/CotA-like multicopper oxidase with cupredoxin domain